MSAETEGWEATDKLNVGLLVVGALRSADILMCVRSQATLKCDGCTESKDHRAVDEEQRDARGGQDARRRLGSIQGRSGSHLGSITWVDLGRSKGSTLGLGWARC